MLAPLSVSAKTAPTREDLRVQDTAAWVMGEDP
jgi:hypothetical protein